MSPTRSNTAGINEALWRASLSTAAHHALASTEDKDQSFSHFISADIDDEEEAFTEEVEETFDGATDSEPTIDPDGKTILHQVVFSKTGESASVSQAAVGDSKETDSIDDDIEEVTGLSNADLIRIIAETFTKIINSDANKAQVSPPIKFYTPVPSVTPLKYLERIKKYYLDAIFKNKDEVDEGTIEKILVAIYILLDRHASYYSTHHIMMCHQTIHRLIAVSMQVAVKYNTDTSPFNRLAAGVCGIPLKEFNALELEFYFNMDFNCLINHSTYNQYVREFKKYYAKNFSAPPSTPTVVATQASDAPEPPAAITTQPFLARRHTR